MLKITFANQMPIVTLPAIIPYSSALAPICFNVSATDANCEGDILTLRKLLVPAPFTTINQAAPDKYEPLLHPLLRPASTNPSLRKLDVVRRVLLSDTLNVTVALNQSPVVTCPGNSSAFVCNLDPICIPGLAPLIQMAILLRRQ